MISKIKSIGNDIEKAKDMAFQIYLNFKNYLTQNQIDKLLKNLDTMTRMD